MESANALEEILLSTEGGAKKLELRKAIEEAFPVGRREFVVVPDFDKYGIKKYKDAIARFQLVVEREPMTIAGHDVGGAELAELLQHSFDQIKVRYFVLILHTRDRVYGF